MIEQRQGPIVRAAEVAGRTGLVGHPGVTAYTLARPGLNSRWLLATLDVVECGGGIEPHYHEGMDFDHA